MPSFMKVVTICLGSVMGQTCNHAPDRLKKGPADFLSIIQDSSITSWSDSSFSNHEMLYWQDFTTHADMIAWDLKFSKQQYSDGKLEFGDLDSIYYPTNQGKTSLWTGETALTVADVKSNNSNEWYMAALASAAGHSQHIQDMFDSGSSTKIFGIRLYVRGKPWIVTVDSQVPITYKDIQKIPYYADVYRYHIWAPILEKAFAKVYGCFDNMKTVGNHPVDALKMITGRPVFNYEFGGENNVEISKFTYKGNEYDHIGATIFSTMENAHLKHKYLMTAVARQSTQYGIVAGRTYSILSVWTQIKTSVFDIAPAFVPQGDAQSNGQVIMLRDPHASNAYNGDLKNPTDPQSDYWTQELKEQIPDRSIYITGNPNEIRSEAGVFMMSSYEFFEAFQSLQIAYDNDIQQFKRTWFDVENDNGRPKSMFINVPIFGVKKSDILVSVETYYQQMIPLSCYSEGAYPTFELQIKQNDNEIVNEKFEDKYKKPIVIKSSSWNEFDQFEFIVTFDWKSGTSNPPSPDYTLMVNAAEEFEILDKKLDGNTTMLHMDGSCPSGFQDSDHSYCKRVHLADVSDFKRIKTVSSLYDVFRSGDDFSETSRIFFRNIWTLFWWYDWFDLFLIK